MKRPKSPSISTIILSLFFSVFFIFSTTLKADQTLFAEKGVVDFSEYKNKKIKYLIKGDALFYWNRFIDPRKIVTGEGKSVSIPHLWGQNGSKKIGSGTYIISFKNTPFTNLGFTFSLNSAYKAYVILDKKVLKIAERGITSLKKERILPWWGNTKTYLRLGNSKDFKLVLHVSNNYFQTGGLYKIGIGSEEVTKSYKKTFVQIDFFVMGALSIFGFYFLYLWSRSTSDQQELYFSLLSLLIAMRLAINGNYIAELIGPSFINYQLILRLNYITFFIYPFIFGKIIFVMFPYLLPKGLKKFSSYSSFFYCFLALAYPFAETLSGPIFKSFQPFFIMTFTCYFYFIFLAVKKKLRYSLISIIALTINIVGGIHDASMSLGALNPAYISEYCTLITVFLMSIYLAERNSKNYARFKKRAIKFRKMAKYEREAKLIQEKSHKRELKNEVINRTKEVALIYNKLELEKLSLEDLMNHHYEQKKSKEVLLNNLEQGYLTFNKEGIVHDGASSMTENLLGIELNDCENRKIKIWDILFKNIDEKDYLKHWVKQVWIGKVPFKDLKEIAPKKIIGINNEIIELEYRPIYRTGTKNKIDRIIVIVTDKTKENLLQKKIERDRIDAEFIKNCLKRPVEFLDLVEDASYFMKCIETKEETKVVYRHAHTLKARFGQFGLKNFFKALNIIENHLSENNMDKVFRAAKNFDQEINEFLKKHEVIVETLKNSTVDKGLAIPVQEVMDKIKEYSNFEDFHFYIYQNYFLSDLRNKFGHYRSLVEEIGRNQGKSIDWEVSGDKIIVDTTQYRDFINASIHIFRNMVDHGIESEDERIEKAKPQSGKITLDFKLNGDSFYLNLKDDGKGINIETLKKKAVEQGIKKQEELNKLADKDLTNLIFTQGLSTKDDVSDISGRGVGMDVVKDEVEKMGGEITVSSKVDEGVEFSIRLPVKA